MDLILWRHAQAELLSDELPNKTDGERKLTNKGLKQATKMAAWLNSVLPHSCKILVSPSQRTIQTANALGRKYKIVAEVGTESGVNEILAACNWPHSREPVLIIGHQPHLGDVVSKLIPGFMHCPIRKGNVWWISQKDSNDAPSTYLKAIMTPELIVK